MVIITINFHYDQLLITHYKSIIKSEHNGYKSKFFELKNCSDL